ncbi:MAG: potassium channel family protein [Salibacteraceae bacterium]
MFSRLRTTIKRFDHVLLLGGLLFLVASPIWEVLIGEGLFWSEVMIMVTLVAGLSVTFTHSKSRIGISQYFGLAVIITSFLDAFVGLGFWFETINHYGQVFYYLFLTLTMLRLVIKANKVDSEVVINSISGYLLIGLSWSILIGVWNVSFPGAFSFSSTEQNFLFDSMYYTYVTMTTLGYGDMLPLTLAAKSFSMLISITGAFYTTIVIGMIVGKYISRHSN